MNYLVRIAAPLLLMTCACTSTGVGEQTKSSRPRNILYQDEIMSSSATDAYEAIRSLRPHWLSGRGMKSVWGGGMASYPTVYIDGFRHGDVNSLRSIRIDNISKIEYLNSGDATIRFGENNAGGAILVTMFY